MQLSICINKANGTKVGQGEEKDLYNSSGQGEEKDGQDRFRLERREGCIEQVQVRKKRKMYRTGSGQREEKDVQDRFRSMRREGFIGQAQVREKRRM